MSVFFNPGALSPERAAVVQKVIEAALRAVDPVEAVSSNLDLKDDALRVGATTYPLTDAYRVLLLGAGKAAPAMARGLVNVLGDRVKKGVLICKHLPPQEDDLLSHGIICLQGNHPVPGIDSFKSAAQLADMLSKCDSSTLVFCLISGGGSALMSLPYNGVSLEDLQILTRLLLASGAEIGEMNALRKHLDQLKGGRLAQLAAPARVISLILSDVVGSPLDVIASGPTTPDRSTFADALAVLKKYGLIDKTPESIIRVLNSGAKGAIPETLKPGDAHLSRVQNLVVGENRTAGLAALDMAKNQGFKTEWLSDSLTGEARQAGLKLAEILRWHRLNQPLHQPLCLVAGGETTVTLHGSGLGGRNQEVALAAVEALSGVGDAALVTLATDGEDGPTDAAGAVVTGESLKRAGSMGIDPNIALAQNDSYHFFESLDDLVKIGPTGTNVNDINLLFLF
jgi:glycerate 2-kinase